MVNKVKGLLGFVLMLNVFLASPALAFYQDSVVNTVDSAGSVSREEAVVPVDTAEVEVDTAAVAGAVADTTGGEAVSGVEGVAGSSATPEKPKEIDPQVYKDIFYYVMFFVLICIIVAIVGKVYHIYTLSKRINGKYNPFANNNLQAGLFLVFLAFFLFGVYYSYSVWGSWSWRDAATAHGADIDRMFMITLTITTFVMIVVHILLLVFSYAYRARKDRTAFFYPHNDSIERLWTIVPAIALTVLVLFGFFTWRSITNIPEDLQKSAIQVEVLGEQFAWTVRYPGADGVIGKRDFKLTSASNGYGIDFNDKASWDDIRGDEIVIPVNKPVRFHIISKDIIHSFYIPDFRVQINAVPGMTNYFQFTPTLTTREMRDKLNDQSYNYVMLCAKICGASHYNMQKNVVVVTEAEYKEWLSKQNKFFTEDLQKEFANSTATEEENTLAANSLN